MRRNTVRLMEKKEGRRKKGEEIQSNAMCERGRESQRDNVRERKKTIE